MDDPATASENVTDENDDEAQSVAERVLQAFIKALAATPGYEDVAARMKTEIIENQAKSEGALRRALFDDDS